MNSHHNLTFCIGTYNNLNYLKLAVESVRKNSFYNTAPFIIHAENCSDGTNEWLEENKSKYNLTLIIEPNNQIVKGIGGSMNVCAAAVTTDYIMFLHSDFYVAKNWDLELYTLFKKYPNDKLVASSYRIQPNIFNEDSRPGTLIVPIDWFGSYYYDFNIDSFLSYAEEFSQLNSFEIRKGEGVSFMIKKCDWDSIGGNDSLFAPASYDDMDLFVRMQMNGYKFVLTSKSVVWHYGARGSHRLEENDGHTSQRQIESEVKNYNNWLKKWGSPPSYDVFGFIKIPEGAKL